MDTVMELLATAILVGRGRVFAGATSGIGLAAAEECAAREATVVLACRDRARAEEAVTDIRTKTRNQNVRLDRCEQNATARCIYMI
jgi:short-subunit dehydrogenase